MPDSRFQSLDIVRAICCLVVFLNHINSNIKGLPQLTPMAMLLNYATEAVILFFVLSGCVIGMRDYRSIGEYLSARVIKIFPAYYIVLGFTVWVMTWRGEAINGWRLIGNATFLQTLQGFIVLPLSYNVATWSLSYEVVYYLLFPLVLYYRPLLWPCFIGSLALGVATYVSAPAAGVTGHVFHVLSFFCLWLIGVGVVRGVKSGHYLSLQSGIHVFVAGTCMSRVQVGSEFYDFMRLFWFAVGAGGLCSALVGAGTTGGGEGAERGRHIPLWIRLSMSGAVLGSLWGFSASMKETRIFLSGLLLVSLFVGERSIGFAARLFKLIGPPLAYVGGLSYTLYLIHSPMVALVNGFEERFVPLGRALVAICVSVGAAHVVDYVLQPKIRELSQRARMRPSA